MKSLVINAGSSSLKCKLIDVDSKTVIVAGNAERIGGQSKVSYIFKGEKLSAEISLKNHKEALQYFVDLMLSPVSPAIESADEIAVIGHRVASGFEKYTESTIIDDDALETIKQCVRVAPLHGEAMYSAVLACREIFGDDKLQVATFDTAFHHTMPKKAYLYPIPYEYYQKHGLRKYGYHGTSTRYVCRRYAEIRGESLEGKRIIVCHIGNGSSISAVKDGKSVDTTMGYTPLDGLIMGTRSGSIDPAVIFHMARAEGISAESIEEVLNRDSGLLGVSGVSGDDRDLIKAAEEGNERAALAREILFYQMKKYIGAYTAVMGGVDCIIFTGGLGEKAYDMREHVTDGLEYLGVRLDKEKNAEENGKEALISTADSTVQVYLIPTDEEMMIAMDSIEIYRAL